MLYNGEHKHENHPTLGHGGIPKKVKGLNTRFSKDLSLLRVENGVTRRANNGRKDSVGLNERKPIGIGPSDKIDYHGVQETSSSECVGCM